MANNNRIFYGSQVAQLQPATTGTNYSSWYQPLGVQSVGFNSTYNTEQTFQLGAIDIYSIAENVPNVEVTINKVLDGTMPLYLMCMGGETGADSANLTNVNDATQQRTKGLGALANNTVNFRLGIYNDTKSYVNSTTEDWVLCSGMYLSSFTYTFPVDGNATEEVSLVGNNKKWKVNNAGIGTFTAVTPTGTYAIAKRLARRQYIDINGSVLPTGSGGLPTGVSQVDLHLQNVTISADLGRDEINELGSFAPYHRYATFPVEVTSEFEIIGTEGDFVQANDFIFQSGCNVNYTNLVSHPIKIKVCGSGSSVLELGLGSGNQLTSVNYAGGDTGGGNVTITYSFRNYNDFYMKATSDYASAPTV